MKRGRKAKRGKATKRTKKVKRTTKGTKGLKNASTPAPKPKAAHDSPLSSSKRKLKTLRKMKSPTKLSSLSLPDEHAETPAEPKTKAAKKETKPAGKASKKRKTSAPAAVEEVASSSWENSTWKEVHQGRVKVGKSWRYEVLEGQTFGCSNCRFIWGGCTACRKATFRGKTARQVFEEQQAQNAGDGNNAPKVKEVKKKRKVSKKGKASKWCQCKLRNGHATRKPSWAQYWFSGGLSHFFSWVFWKF